MGHSAGIIYSAGEAERLIWNDACTHNLANYVRENMYRQRKARHRPKWAWSLKHAMRGHLTCCCTRIRCRALACT